MRYGFALLSLCLLAACSASDGQHKDAKAKSDPIEAQAQSLEKAADASVKIVEKDAQQQIDAAKAQNQAATATPEE